jgi:histidinol phosphatase-like PHP family hydrolase
VNAINNHHDKISCIGHFCKKGINDTVDLKVVVKLANKYHIPIEFNGNVFRTGSTDLDKMETMLNLVDQIYVNSDAHTLADLSNKQKVFDYLKEKGHF